MTRKISFSGLYVTAMLLLAAVLISVPAAGPSIAPVLPPVEAHNPNVPTISEYGTATVDGVIQPGEYNSCYSHSGTPPQSMMFCEKNDQTNDYYAVQVTGSQSNLKDVMYILFDNNHDGAICSTSGRPLPEDAVGLDAQGNFMDMRYCGVPTGPGPYPPNTLPLTSDVSGGGHSDGTGMTTYSAATQTYTFELSHPMSSGDFGADYSLSVGSTVGWCVYFWDEQTSRVWDLPVDCFVQYANGGQYPNGGQSPPSAAFFGDLTKLGGQSAVCDLAIAKDFSQSVLQSPGTATITLTVTNPGGAACISPAAVQTSVTDVLPPGLATNTLVTVNPSSGWNCPDPIGTTTVQCTTNNIMTYPLTPPITISFGVTVNVQGNTLTNCAHVSNQLDQYAPNNDDCVTVTVTGTSGCDMSITKTMSLSSDGQTVEIILTVANVGDSPCLIDAPLTVTDTMPTGLVAVYAGGAGWTCNLAVVCQPTASSLQPHTSTTITIKADVHASGTINNCAQVVFTPDTNQSNNTDCAKTTVPPPSGSVATFIAHFYRDRNDATGAGIDPYPFQVTVSEGFCVQQYPGCPPGGYTSRVYVGTDVTISLTSLNPTFTIVVCTPMPSCLSPGQISDYTHIIRIPIPFAVGQTREFNFYGLGVTEQGASMEGIPRIEAEEIGANPILSFKITSTADGTVRTLSYNLTQQTGKLTLLDTLIDHDITSAPLWAVSERGVAPGGSGGDNLKPSLSILGRNEDKDGKIVSTILGRDDNCRIISSVQGGYVKITRVPDGMGLFGVTGQWANGSELNPLSPTDHIGASDISLVDSQGNTIMPNSVFPQFMVAPGSYTLEIKNTTMLIDSKWLNNNACACARVTVRSGQDTILDIETPMLSSYESNGGTEHSGLLLHDGLNRAYSVQSTLTGSTTINVSLSYAEGSTFWVATLLPKSVGVQSVQSSGNALEYTVSSLASWNLLVTTVTPGIDSYTITLTTPTTTTSSLSNPAGPRCVIATAAYGSDLAAPVQFLRGFRDNQVQKTGIGSVFMQAFNSWYYSWAPSVAQQIAPNENYKAVTRVIIAPLIGSLFVGHALFSALAPLSPELAVVATGILSSALIGLIYLTPVYALTWKLSKRRITKRTICSLAIVAGVLVLIATLTTGTFSASANLTALTVVETMLLTPAFMLRKMRQILD